MQTLSITGPDQCHLPAMARKNKHNTTMKNLIQTIAASAFLFFVQNLFGQDAEAYAKTANRLVELINAADYSGVENLFNKEMSKALPLNKATEFFAGMKARSGTIQK